jgi:hypothetical protein
MLRRAALLTLTTTCVAVSPAQTVPPAPPATVFPPPSVAPQLPATRDRPFATFDTASQSVREAVTAASATAATAVASLDEAIRLGIVQPAGAATVAGPALPPTVEALPAAVARANAAIVTESRTTRAPALAPREDAVQRLRQATTEAERQKIIDELRTGSGQRLEAQREDARTVRDRLRQLRELTTLNRPSGN